MKTRTKYKHQDALDTYLYVLDYVHSAYAPRALVRARLHNLVKDTYYENVNVVVEDSELYKWIEVNDKE